MLMERVPNKIAKSRSIFTHHGLFRQGVEPLSRPSSWKALKIWTAKVTGSGAWRLRMTRTQKKRKLPLPRNPKYEEEALGHLRGYYILQYPKPAKCSYQKRWQTQRRTVEDITYSGGNTGLILGPIYDGGHGWFEVDIDDPEGLDPVLECLTEAGVLERSHYGIVRSGGHHHGWKVICWQHSEAWWLSWPNEASLNGVEVELRGRRGRGFQTVVPPSRVINYYKWEKPIPSHKVVTNWAAKLPEDEITRHVDAWEKLRAMLEHPDDLDYPELDLLPRRQHGDVSNLPTLVEGELRRLLEALAGVGVTFGKTGSSDYRDGIHYDRDDRGGQRIFAVILHRCPHPECRGHGFDALFQSSEAGKTWITPGFRLKCFHAHSCDIGRREAGMRFKDWLPRYFPELEKKFFGGAGESPVGMTLEQGIKETRSFMEAAVIEADADPSAVIVIDAPPGTGKTGVWIEMGIQQAERGGNPAIFGPRHDLMDEAAGRSLPILDKDRAFTPEPPRVVPLEGARVICKYKGNRFRFMEKCSKTGILALCRSCSDRDTCAYHKQWEWAAEAGSFMVTTYWLMNRVVEDTPHAGAMWVDELPGLTEMTEISLDEICRYRDMTTPGELSGLEGGEEQLRRYVLARKDAAIAYAKVVTHVGLKKPDEFRRFFHGRALRALLTSKELFGKDEFRQAIDYDLGQGEHPSYRPDEPSSQPIPLVTSFDDFRRPLLNLLEKKENLDDGIVAAYLDPKRKCGLVLMKRTNLIPQERGAVITAAGSGLRKPYIEALLNGRNVAFRTVAVQDSEWVEQLGVDVRVLTKKYRVERYGRVSTVRHILRRLLPRIVMWGAKHNKESLRIGIACAQELADDLREAQREEHDPRLGELADVLELYRGCGFELIHDGVGHYGGLEGSNHFREVDVWTRLGDNIPNLGEMKFLAHGLNAEGIDISETLLRETETTYRDIQDAGRARPKERTRETPLLDIKCGYAPAGCGDSLKVKGQPPKLTSLLYELTAMAYLTYLGWCSVPEMEEFLLRIEHGPDLCQRAHGELPGYSQELFPPLLSRSLRHLFLLMSKRATGERHWFSRERAREYLEKVAERMGAVGRKCQGAGGGPKQAVYIVPGIELPPALLDESDE